MPSDQKIDYVEFPAKNLGLVDSFFSSTFGWTFTDYGPEYRAFSDGTLNGGFFKSDLQSTTENGAALIVIFASDLEATQNKIVANGGTLCREIFSFPGGRRFHFLDPHGNELAVWSDK